jgi:phosphate:Na+ symporter
MTTSSACRRIPAAGSPRLALRKAHKRLDTTKDPEAAPGAAIFKAIGDASKRLADERTTGRDKILQDVALQRTSAERARSALELLGWADGTFYHAWRLAESLRIASGNQPAVS